MNNKTFEELAEYLFIIDKEHDLEFHKMTAKNLIRVIRNSVAEEIKEIIDSGSEINVYGVYLLLKNNELENA